MPKWTTRFAFLLLEALLAMQLSPPALAAEAPKTIAELEAEWQLTLPMLKDFTAASRSDVTSGSLKSSEIRLQGKSGQLAKLLLTSGLSAAAAKNLLVDQVRDVFDLYSRKYRGNFAFERKNCVPKKRMLKTETGDITLIEGFAGKNLKFGFCKGASDAAYAVVAAFLACPKRGMVVELYYFFPPTENAQKAHEALSELSCSLSL